MMSIGLIERLSLRQEESTVVTYFFCQNANDELNTIEAIIKGLILRLVDQQKGLSKSFAMPLGRCAWAFRRGTFRGERFGTFFSYVECIVTAASPCSTLVSVL